MPFAISPDKTNRPTQAQTRCRRGSLSHIPRSTQSLFWVPVSRVQQRRIYWVRMQGRKTSRKAHLEGRAWWIGDKLLGRLVDSAEIRKPIERVLAAIVSVADTMAATIEDPEPGIGSIASTGTLWTGATS